MNTSRSDSQAAENAPRRRPSQERSRFLVASLVEATERVLGSKGFASASVRTIAKVAGVSAGSLYQYFDGKDSLVGNLIERRLEDDLTRLRVFFAQALERPLDEGVREGVALLVPEEEWKKDAFVAMVDSIGEVNREGVLRDALEELVELLTEFFSKHPELSLRDPAISARIITFSLRAAAIEMMRSASVWNAAEVRNELVRWTLNYLR